VPPAVGLGIEADCTDPQNPAFPREHTCLA
jgi:hypothetical protein